MTLTTRVWRAAHSLYPAHGYHTFGHASEVVERATCITERTKRYGLAPNREIVLIGSLLHDIGAGLIPSDVWLPRLTRYARTQEEVSIYLSRQMLERFHAPEALIAAVEGVIDGTHAMRPITSLEAKIVAAADLGADLGGLAGPYPEFYANSEALRREAAWRSGNPMIPPATFARAAMNHLAYYLARRIHLTPEYYTEVGQSRFHLGAMQNLLTYLQRVVSRSDHLTVHGELGCGKVPLILDDRYAIDTKAVYIGIDIDNLVRQPALRHIQARYQAKYRFSPLAFVIPGELRGISLPSASLSTLYVVNTLRHLSRFPIEELWRVTQPSGRVHIIETYHREGSYPRGSREVDRQKRTRDRFARRNFSFVETRSYEEGWEMIFDRPE